jgi:malonate-semialdehyde dehydrogenase (acetylating)/methylmalonate-semialdehyde dehydrogenase
MTLSIDTHALDLPTLGNFVNGKRTNGTGTKFATVFDPAKGVPRAQVHMGSSEDVDHAVAAAHQALQSWSALPAAQRARCLFRFKELLERNADEIAALITAEHGKTISDARAELMRGIDVVEFACGMPHLLKGEYSANASSSIDTWSVRHSLGVCAGITPFNFPAMVPLWMFPIALGCGNTFVLKPSEKDPSCALRLAELLIEAGVPPGVFNVVNGGRESVDALLAHPDVSAVSFVGSTPIARYVFEQASRHAKRVQALGGAKNHLVVMPDADVGSAARALIGAAYGSAGERCMAVSVAVAVGNAADALVATLKPLINALRIGAGTQDVDMGPLVTAEHRARVREYIDIGVREGAELVIDGRNHPAAEAQGYFLGPTLFDRVSSQMRIYREEIFGPVLVIVRVESLAQAMRLIETHEYGNGASIYTQSGAVAREFCAQAQAGMLGVNVPIPVPAAFHSFGGWKRSMFGDLNVYGVDAVRFYTRTKTITARWGQPSDAQFVMPTLGQQ